MSEKEYVHVEVEPNKQLSVQMCCAPFWAMASTYYKSSFCQNCGADMRGEQDDSI